MNSRYVRKTYDRFQYVRIQSMKSDEKEELQRSLHNQPINQLKMLYQMKNNIFTFIVIISIEPFPLSGEVFSDTSALKYGEAFTSFKYWELSGDRFASQVFNWSLGLSATGLSIDWSSHIYFSVMNFKKSCCDFN